jgi:hypothetical protein
VRVIQRCGLCALQCSARRRILIVLDDGRRLGVVCGRVLISKRHKVCSARSIHASQCFYFAVDSVVYVVPYTAVLLQVSSELQASTTYEFLAHDEKHYKLWLSALSTVVKYVTIVKRLLYLVVAASSLRCVADSCWLGCLHFLFISAQSTSPPQCCRVAQCSLCRFVLTVYVFRTVALQGVRRDRRASLDRAHHPRGHIRRGDGRAGRQQRVTATRRDAPSCIWLWRVQDA